MPKLKNHTNLLAVVNAIVDGRIAAEDAGYGMPQVIKDLFDIAGNLGNLSRGRTAEFTPPQAVLLHGLIDSAVDMVLSGEPPKKMREKIAARLMDLAFELDDPMSWIIKLIAIRDGGETRSVQVRARAG